MAVKSKYAKAIKLAGTMSVKQILVECGMPESAENAFRAYASYRNISLSFLQTRGIKWTAERDQYLKDNCQTVSLVAAAKHLGVSRTKIGVRCRELGITFKKVGARHFMTVIPDEDVRLIDALFREDMSIELIAEKMEVPIGTINRVLNRVGSYSVYPPIRKEMKA